MDMAEVISNNLSNKKQRIKYIVIISSIFVIISLSSFNSNCSPEFYAIAAKL